MIRQQELIAKIQGYDPQVDTKRLEEAMNYSLRAHAAQTRRSGEPYFTHPLEVANILADMHLDERTIMTALLHDTVEDTEVTLDDIKSRFGADVASLVDGVTKLSKIQIQSAEGVQAENFRKLVLAMSEDIRVLLVKLADRLHNLRTLHHIPRADKRAAKAKETMEIFAPLASRIGMRDLADELEDLAFSHINKDARDSILARLEFLRLKGTDLVQKIIAEFKSKLAEHGIKPVISGREKTVYSIWQKMQRKNVGFEQLSDIMAFRINVDTVAECYAALGIIHSAYAVVPARFKDYISTPKPNGYQSLHTTVLGPDQQRIEVQIRTHEMHEIAELGVAAHWHYKSTDGKTIDLEDKTKYRWLRELLDILEYTQGAEEFLEHTKMDMFQDQVFCFTPKGDLFSLPKGSTPVDFAYAIHSGVGNAAVGAKINGRIMPLKTELHNGDQVEIITSKTQTPSPSWEQFVVTGKAKAAIRRFIRIQQRQQYMDLGKAIMQKTFKQEGFSFSPALLSADILKKFGTSRPDDLFAKVGEGLVSAQNVISALYPSRGLKHTAEAVLNNLEEGKIPSIQKANQKPKTKSSEPIKGLIPGMAVYYAKCCHPLPGERIVGIITSGKGVAIHSHDCETLKSFENEPNRFIDVSWEDEAIGLDSGNSFVGRMMILLSNVKGAVVNLTNVIGRNEGNIISLNITSRTSEFCEVMLDVEVSSLKHFIELTAALRALPDVKTVERVRQ